MVATVQVIIITGNPAFIHSRVVIGYGPRSAIATVMTLALEPIGVAFPPKPAPIASAQNNGAVESSPLLASVMLTMTGIIAAVKGMLSMIALEIAETQMIATASNTSSEPKLLKIHPASCSR